MNDAKANHLINEKSPYLIQHAHNPVEWYPWGKEAFEKARKENKPILLSIGYSTCHWCHVMEKESFSDTAIAAVMNENVVSIKVDREERPDVDKIYMTAVQVMAGQGGWPLNVFLTPELKPFYGGTYFPPENRWGRVGWPDLVRKVGQAWSDPAEQEKIRSSAENLTARVGTFLAGKPEEGELNASILKKGIKTFEEDYDSVLGGFGGAPKFPMPVNLNFLLSCRTPETLAMTLNTLKAMARGGIYDQIGGGFYRYSTDESWHVPHFEKMLYDNAQLARAYLDNYAASHDEFLAKIARESLDYVLRDMTHPQGGFYSAEDADSLPPDKKEKSEGAFYLWKKKDILDLLGNEDGEKFSFVYGVRDHGNAEADPQGDFAGKNILYLAHSVDQAAAEFKTSDEKILASIENGRRNLFAARLLRPRPHRDDKILTCWNGLMISALARGWQVLGDPRYLEAARKAGRFIRAELYDDKTGRLHRRWRDGDKKVAGLADDYAFFARACLDIYESDFDIEWYRLAERLMDEIRDRFYDTEPPGLFMAEKLEGKDLILRARDDADNVEPSATSVAVENALRISRITGQDEWEKWGEGILRSFAKSMEKNPRAHPQMMASLSAYLSKPVQILLVGKLPSPEMESFLKIAYRNDLPHRVLIAIQDRWRAPKEFPWVYETIKAETRERGPVTAYVCANYACHIPTANPEEFQRQISPP